MILSLHQEQQEKPLLAATHNSSLPDELQQHTVDSLAMRTESLAVALSIPQGSRAHPADIEEVHAANDARRIGPSSNAKAQDLAELEARLKVTVDALRIALIEEHTNAVGISVSAQLGTVCRLEFVYADWRAWREYGFIGGGGDCCKVEPC
jgi:hypothetical protein